MLGCEGDMPRSCGKEAGQTGPADAVAQAACHDERLFR